VSDSAIEAALRRAAAGDAAGDLSVVYSDMHGLWGGLTVTVAAGGWERSERRPGDATVAVTRGPIGPDALAALAQLLIEIRAWEQVERDIPPVAGESRATLTIRAGGSVAVAWERVNDLAAGRRLSRVRDTLVRLTTP
jgi:hypothetical protein